MTDMLDTLLENKEIVGQIFNKCVEDVYSNAPVQLKMFFSKEYIVARMLTEFNELVSKEGKTLTEFLRDHLRARIPQTLDAARPDLASNFASQIAVLSLSAVPDNEVMWSHYADLHRGVVLAFDSADPFLANVIKVKYQTERPTIDMSARPPEGVVWKEGLQCICGTKNEAWAYEQEYRLAAAVIALTPTGLNDAQGYPVLVNSVPPSALTSVIFGARIQSSIRASIDEALLSLDFSHVAKICEYLDSNTYKVALGECPE